MVFDPERALARGLEVLRLEAEALQAISTRVGPSFQEACRLILDCTGQVVVTGMGKAGIIGQKVSATLASTGTPSLSLHPADALHGDLGRVRKEDVVLAFSMSGKTRELVALLPAVRTIGAPVLAVTGSLDSPVARQADVVVEVGPLDEACPLGLAPTVTTTAMLALGDAIAMAVQESREFTREDFAAYHPAGDLGRKLLKVGEIMRKGNEVPLLRSGEKVREALVVMTETPGRPGAALVVDAKGVLKGIFTDGDLRRLIQSQDGAVLEQVVDLYMAPSPKTIQPDQLVNDVQHLFKSAHVDQVPVVNADGVVVGLVDVQDLLEVRL